MTQIQNFQVIGLYGEGSACKTRRRLLKWCCLSGLGLVVACGCDFSTGGLGKSAIAAGAGGSATALAIPPIDAAAPARYETASFGLG